MVFGRHSSSKSYKGIFSRSSSSGTNLPLDGPTLGRRTSLPVQQQQQQQPTVGLQIAEDECEVVPQFFPGYQINSPPPSAIHRMHAKNASLRQPSRRISQRRAGCIKLSPSCEDAAQQQSVRGEQPSRRCSNASSVSSSSTLSAVQQQQQQSAYTLRKPAALSNAAQPSGQYSTKITQQLAHQYSSPEVPVVGVDLSIDATTAADHLQQEPAHESTFSKRYPKHASVSSATAPNGDIPSTYSYRRRGSTISSRSTTSNTSSNGLTSGTRAGMYYANGGLSPIQKQPQGHAVHEYSRHRSAPSIHRQSPNAGQLHRNNTTRTVSRNDLSPELHTPGATGADGSSSPASGMYGRRLTPSRSANFANHKHQAHYYQSPPQWVPPHSPTIQSPLARSPLAYDYSTDEYAEGHEAKQEDGCGALVFAAPLHGASSTSVGGSGSPESSTAMAATSQPPTLSDPPKESPRALNSSRARINGIHKAPVTPPPATRHQQNASLEYTSARSYELTSGGGHVIATHSNDFDEDDTDIASKLVPKIDSFSPQIAYLPPRTANLTITN